MGKGVASRVKLGAGCAAAALGVLHPAPARADTDILSANTLELTGDVRLVAVDGERSWVDGGFGKLRSGSKGNWRVEPQLGNAYLVWEPQFGAFSATVVGTVQGGQRTSAGLSQAYVTYRPLRRGKLAVSARAGLMWPPASLEHEGPTWEVRDSITPSAIGSWLGEEVRPLALEANLSAELGAHKLRATAAIMGVNDTAGTLLAFRGWALHDRTTIAFRREPLPPLPESMIGSQPQFTHPLLDVRPGFLDRPGYYAKLAWQTPLPVRIELFRYDNRADPDAYNQEYEWGWRTDFNTIGLIADLGAGTMLRAQGLTGRTLMGEREIGSGRWIDARFRAAYALLIRPFGAVTLAARAEAFGVTNHGSFVDGEYDDRGWSAMLSGRRSWGALTGVVELLHVSSKRDDRADFGLRPRQRQTQLQATLRFRW